MPLRLAVGLGITAVMFAIAGRRFFWLFRLISAGESATPNRFRDVPKRAEAELVEVGGQRKLLKWTVPGLAHFFTFWGFTLLLFTILEAYGDLFQRQLPHPHHRAHRRSRLHRGLLGGGRAGLVVRLRRYPHQELPGP